MRKSVLGQLLWAEPLLTPPRTALRPADTCVHSASSPSASVIPKPSWHLGTEPGLRRSYSVMPGMVLLLHCMSPEEWIFENYLCVFMLPDPCAVFLHPSVSLHCLCLACVPCSKILNHCMQSPLQTQKLKNQSC